MKATLSSLAPNEQRQSRRRLVNFAAALSEEGAQTAPVGVSDISEGGCRLQCDEQFLEGSEMWLKLPGLEARRIKVIWSGERALGCEFETPLYPAEIEILDPPKRRPDPKSIFRRA